MNSALQNLILTVAVLPVLFNQHVEGASGSAEPTIAVCMQNQNHMFAVQKAQAITTQMYAAVGVRIEWHRFDRACQSMWDHPILIELTDPDPRYRPGILADAQPFGEPRIRVFYERVQGARPTGGKVYLLLAHVLAHEIAHIAEGSGRHSETGVMKADWDGKDQVQMEIRPLSFSQSDARMIHEGLDARFLPSRSRP
jgi:hypothetical protein